MADDLDAHSKDDVSGMTEAEAAASITADLINILSEPPPGSGLSEGLWVAHVISCGIEVMIKQRGVDDTIAELRRYADELEAQKQSSN